MASSQDTEITLGTGKLLVLFFGLVAICAVFFGLGYTLGRKSEPGLASAAPATQASANSSKPDSAPQAETQPPQMTFYKSVEQKEPSAELAPAVGSTTTSTPATATPATSAATQPPAPSAPDPTAIPTGPGYVVQVAAVSKQEDAQALVEALKKKDYPAFVASASSNDKLFHVQLGPYPDIKDAEAIRTKLVSDGYSPILKK
jgi:cell division septation protein DedD